MAEIGWVFYSPEQKKRVDNVLKYFEEKGIVDELGLGAVRDAFANILFPGTSTIQTRAKYFLLVPYCMREIEKQPSLVENYMENLRKKETSLIKTLLKGKDADNIIGKNKQDKLQTFPSSIYWNGLKKFGIIKLQPNQSISEYFKLRKYYSRKERGIASEKEKRNEELRDDNDAFRLKNFWSTLPIPKKDWLSNEDIRLTKEEAGFLKTKILTSQGKSLFGFLLKDEIDISEFNSLYDFYLRYNNSLPCELKQIVKLACDFEIVMRGAIILYNILLQDQRSIPFEKDPKLLLKQWQQDYRNYDLGNFSPIDIEPFLTKGNRFGVMQFINDWFNLLKMGKANSDIGNNLIRRRELNIKKNRARLNSPAKADTVRSLTALFPFNDGSDRSLYLTYRFKIVQRLLNDIYEGLKNA